MKSFFLPVLATLVCCLFIGCASTDDARPARSSRPLLTSSEADVSLQLVAHTPDRQARIRLTNNCGSVIAWDGYPSTPWYRIRQRDLLGWHERDVGWFCGKGLETRRLNPRSSIEFLVDLPKWDFRRIQVGLDYSTPAKPRLTVWSPAFRP